MPYFGKKPAETALGTDDIEDDIISTVKLKDDIISTVKLKDDAVTLAKTDNAIAKYHA